MQELNNTQYFKVEAVKDLDVRDVIAAVYSALTEKGYNPVNQIVGYLMSGDPTYITSHKGARSLIMRAERDEIIEVFLEDYIEKNLKEYYVCILKIMGLDYGSVTVGVAISDSMLLTAQPVEVIKRKSENKLRQTLARIQVLAEENDVGRIVLGYPKNMNNSEGERVERTKEFMEKLKARTGLEVVLWDERLSTVSAMDVLKEGGVRSEHRKTYVDKIAASLILQGYLDSIHN